ncbi:MAG: FG-GAP repeat protein [Myxococcales bacterium]|nr:FG-GAP repeat protein [Myxococcales bacterium]
MIWWRYGWIVVALVTSSYGCPRTIMCAPGEVIVAGQCAADCPVGSMSGCRDTGVSTDTANDAVDSRVEARDVVDASDERSCAAGQTRCGGACVDLSNSTDHCGRCDMRCSADGGTAVCSMGMCSLNCASGSHACGDACLPNDAVSSCGARCSPCPAPPGGRATCAMEVCGVECLPGFERVGDACEARVPRPVFPPGTSTVTNMRPTFSWVLGVGSDGAVVEVCRDRACATRVTTFDASGSSGRPAMDLPASTALFWRLRGRVGTIAGTRFSPTWQFRTRAVGTPVDTAYGTELDVNGDGYADLAVGAPGAGSDSAGVVRVFRGSTAGLSPTSSDSLAGSFMFEGDFGSRVVAAGDVDGDGFADLAVADPGAYPTGRIYSGQVVVYRGSATGIINAPFIRVDGVNEMDFFGQALAAAGDVDADGFADFIASSSRTNESVLVYGNATGMSLRTTRLPGTNRVAGGMDLDGDRFSDVALGDENLTVASIPRRGGAFVFHGSSRGLEAMPRRTLFGALAGDRFGVVANVGDIDGDGFSDLAIGAPFKTPLATPETGALLFYFGSSMGIGEIATFQIDGTRTGQLFGAFVNVVGDVDLDGRTEFAVGDVYASPGGVTSAGEIFVISVSAARGVSRWTTISGTASPGSLGRYFGGGDVDGDSRADLIACGHQLPLGGEPDVGAVHVYRGLSSGVSSTRLRSFFGTNRNESFGVGLTMGQ